MSSDSFRNGARRTLKWAHAFSTRLNGRLEAREVSARSIPLLVRPREEGCLRHQKISAKPTLAPQTGWSLTSHVSLRATTFLDGCALSGLRGLRPPSAP